MNFSLNWFKSKLQRKLEELKVEEQIIRNQLLERKLEKNDKPVYKNLKLVNDIITIVLNDGTVLSKSKATQDDFMAIRNAKDENEILSIVMDEEVYEQRRKEQKEYNRLLALQQGISILKNLDDFDVDGMSVYLKGTKRSMPQLLVERFIEIVNVESLNGNLRERLNNNEEFQGLKRFFMWCCLNPRAEVADKLYSFLSTNSFRITKQGFFVALRNVVTLHGGTELVQFVSNTYNKVKAIWKKSPDDYTVFLKDGSYTLVHNDDLEREETVTCEHCEGTGNVFYEEFEESYDCEYCDGTGEYTTSTAVYHGEYIGGLTELYIDLPNRHENRFTDAHTRTFDIRIGRPVSMPPEQCSWSTVDCAEAGLHFTSDHINYVGCGDVSVLILINPMKVVGIGELKGRCYEYLPIMTVPTEESTTILHDLDFDTLELDEDYAIRELANLAEKAKEGFSTEAMKYDFNIPTMSSLEINSIVTSLEDMKETLSKRVSSIE